MVATVDNATYITITKNYMKVAKLTPRSNEKMFINGNHEIQI